MTREAPTPRPTSVADSPAAVGAAQHVGDLAQRLGAHAPWAARPAPERLRSAPKSWSTSSCTTSSCGAAASCSAVGGVLLELGAERRERERLEQVEHDALGHRPAYDLGVARRGHRDDVAQVAGGAEPLQQAEAVAVGQVHVEQHEVDPGSAARWRIASPAERATPASSKPVDAADVLRVRLGRQLLVLDDEHADGHRVIARLRGG